MAEWLNVAEVKASLSECIRTVERGGGVVITRHGKPVAAIVPTADLERLERLRQAGPEGGLASVAGGWSGSEEIVRAVATAKRTRKRARPAA